MLHAVDLPARRGLIGTPAALVLASVALQIGYPLLDGAALQRLTIAIVLTSAAASVAHAVSTRGAGVALGLVVAAGGIGFAAEVLSMHTGAPFGRYAYAPTLGVRLAGVPVVIAPAWLMMAWPAALVARRLVTTRSARVAVGAWALASWDLFLDPQMVAAGHWTWANPRPHLPGVATVPLGNLLGWMLVSLAISLVLQGILGSDDAAGDDGWMFGSYLWTYGSSGLALLVFLHLQAAALWGLVGMGPVAVALTVRLRRAAR